MSSERKILKTIMYLLEDLSSKQKEKAAIKEIELIYDEKGLVIGYRVNIIAKPLPGLRIIKDD